MANVNMIRSKFYFGNIDDLGATNYGVVFKVTDLFLLRVYLPDACKSYIYFFQFYDRPVKRMRTCNLDPDKGSRQRRMRQRRKPDRSRRSRNITRVAKRRERRPCTCSRCFKKPICRKNFTSVCVYVVNKRIGTDTMPLVENAALLKPKGSIQGSSHSVDLPTSASRHQSVSSYNSFDSLDHPPVV